MYADLVTVAGFKPVVAAEKSPGGFDSLPLPFLFSRESSGTSEMSCLFHRWLRALFQVLGDRGELFEGGFEVGGDVSGDDFGDFGGGKVCGFFEGVVLQPEDVQVQLGAFCQFIIAE